MSEMIERVAKAIGDAGSVWISEHIGTGWADIPESIFAVAAIEAMREPTEAMSREGDLTINPHGADSHPGHNHAWRAMIDAALKA